MLIDNTGDAVGYAPEGLVLKLMANHFAEALPVVVSGNSPQQPVQGTPLVDIPTVPIGSPTYPLDVVAALSSDRKSFILSVVNPTEEEHVFSPRVAGVNLRGQGKLWQIAAPSVDTTNVPGKKPFVDIVESPQNALSDHMRVPAISVNVYEFEIGNT